MEKIKLDLGCGNGKIDGWIGIDKREIEGVDIVHDIEIFPWPLADESCSQIRMNHFIEHIKPWLTIEVMDECWRVIEGGGHLELVTPYATSKNYYQDPTHCNPWNEATPLYFSPSSGLYSVYTPKPWKIIQKNWSPNIVNVVFEKLPEGE